MYFIGAFVVLSGVLLASFLKGIPIALFLNVPVITVILFAIAGFLISTSNSKTFAHGVKAVISSKYNFDDAERESAAGLFKILSKVVIFASLIALMFGLISVLYGINDAETVGFRLTTAIIAPISGLAISLAFFEPAAYVLKKEK